MKIGLTPEEVRKTGFEPALPVSCFRSTSKKYERRERRLHRRRIEKQVSAFLKAKRDECWANRNNPEWLQEQRDKQAEISEAYRVHYNFGINKYPYGNRIEC